MLETLGDLLQVAMGLDREVQDVNAAQMALRAIVIYASAVVLVRFGSKRFLGKATPFDIIVAIMLGSILGRAINSSAPFLPTVLASAALVAMHWLFAVFAFHTRFFGPVIKGEPRLLIKDGEVEEDAMRRSKLSTRDLEEALRLRSGDPDPSKVRRAYLERNGNISVIPFPPEPRIIDVSVEDGVQKVRIGLG